MGYLKIIFFFSQRLLKEDKSLDGTQQRLLEKYVLEGRFNGSDLNESAMKTYLEACRKLEENKANYRTKVEKATAKFSHTITDPEAVRAFPSELLRATAVDPSAPSRGPWKITLQPHIYQSFMEHCPDPLLRWNVWRAVCIQTDLVSIVMKQFCFNAASDKRVQRSGQHLVD